MNLRKFRIKRIALALVTLLLTWVAFTSRINYMRSGVAAGEQPVDSVFTAKMLMKTIPCSDPRTDLIGFEVHTKYVKHAGNTRTEYNVVMHELNPSVDTYKTYCHDIVANLASALGPNEDITIHVFDSFEAYCFYNDADLLTQGDNALLAQHLVATYERGREWNDEQYCTLTFYPYAANKLRETMGCNL